MFTGIEIGCELETWELNGTRATTPKCENAGVASQGRAITAQLKTSALQQVTGVPDKDRAENAI